MPFGVLSHGGTLRGNREVASGWNILVGLVRIELTSVANRATALPLSYRPVMVGKWRIELPKFAMSKRPEPSSASCLNVGASPGSRTLLDLLKREVHLPLCQRRIILVPTEGFEPSFPTFVASRPSTGAGVILAGLYRVELYQRVLETHVRATRQTYCLVERLRHHSPCQLTSIFKN